MATHDEVGVVDHISPQAPVDKPRRTNQLIGGQMSSLGHAATDATPPPKHVRNVCVAP